MDFFDQLEKGRYGSFELKRQVGPNLLKGLLISIVIHSTVIASPFIIARFFADDSAIPDNGNTRVIYLDTPPLVTDNPDVRRMVNIKPTLPDVRTAIPKAVKPEEVDTETPVVPDQIDLIRKFGTVPKPEGDGDGKGTDVLVYREPAPDPEEVIPDPTILKIVEVEPQPLAENPQPEYPEMAQISGTEGRVYVRMYVDKHGIVKKWQIVKANPAGVGFEEEIAKVVPKWKFTPAIQQGTAVGVWVAVPFNFRVKK